MAASAEERRRHRAEELSAGRTMERRTFPASLECRDGSVTSDGWTLHGVAAVMDETYPVGDLYVERLLPGSFKRTLKSDPDVSLLVNHEGLPLARTRAGTLHLEERNNRLEVRAHLDPNDPDSQTLKRKLQRGDLDGQMSFAFMADDQTWSHDYSERTLKAVTIHRGDVSIVVQGANANTSAEIRAWETESRAKYTQKERDEAADAGEAMAGGRYPVKDREDLKNAIHAVGRGGGSHDAIRKHIIARAKALGLSSLIPDNWNSDGSLASGSRAAESTECNRCGGSGKITLRCPNCSGEYESGGLESDGSSPFIAGSVAPDGRSYEVSPTKRARERLVLARAVGRREGMGAAYRRVGDPVAEARRWLEEARRRS